MKGCRVTWYLVVWWLMTVPRLLLGLVSPVSCLVSSPEP